jgi:hypothetical protein
LIYHGADELSGVPDPCRVLLLPIIKKKMQKKIRSLLVKRGIEVAGIATTGAQVLAMVTSMDEGVVICGYPAEGYELSGPLSRAPRTFSDASRLLAG